MYTDGITDNELQGGAPTFSALNEDYLRVEWLKYDDNRKELLRQLKDNREHRKRIDIAMRQLLESKPGEDRYLSLPDGKVRLSKRSITQRIDRDYLISAIGSYVVGKKYLNLEQARTFAVECTRYLLKNLKVTVDYEIRRTYVHPNKREPSLAALAPVRNTTPDPNKPPRLSREERDLTVNFDLPPPNEQELMGPVVTKRRQVKRNAGGVTQELLQDGSASSSSQAAMQF